ncbi:MAG TPA: YqaJ viral recombinase family protein [Homoserinimonas sp.]|nr:YqaJ viral recombinase family protein [Homoserinimonas sp.]
MTIVQPTLDLWDEPAPDHRQRILAHSTDRVAWLRARSRGITATDVAKLSSERSVLAVAKDKYYGSRFSGNAFTDHGREREPEIADWVKANHGIDPSAALYHAHGETAHLATPDGVALIAGAVVLAEIKTTNSAWKSIPRSYLRQVFWQQYVLGAERTLVVWEQHDNFVPIGPEPRCQWVDRDDNEIHILVGLANRVLETLRSGTLRSDTLRRGTAG